MTDRSVSVVIATRERPELLRRAIAGVLTQEHDAPIEIVVVFDRSEPDATIADHPALTDRTDRTVVVTTNVRSPGLAGARNSGVAMARHAWIAFCDDDDEWLPGKLTAQFAAIDRTPGARVATTGVLIHFEGQDTPRVPEPSVLTFEGFLDDRMTEVHPSATLASAELLAEMGDVDESIPGGYGEDYDWLLRAARLSPFAVAPEPLVRVYWHGSSFFFERWKTIDEALEFLVEKYPEFRGRPAGLARIRGQQAIARGAMKQRGAAVRTAIETLRLNPTEKRAPVALLIAAGVPASAILKSAHKFGKGL